MILIDKNENLINALSGNLSLISGSLQRIDLHVDENGGLVINVRVGLLYDPGKRVVELVFSGIKEYLLYASHPSLFFYVEDYKFIKSDRGIYLSLDPFWEDGLSEISVKDQNYILSEQVTGYFIKP